MAEMKGLDPKVADRLLDLLSTDDAFRELFQKNPAAALRQVGPRDPNVSRESVQNRQDSLNADDSTQCYQVAQLASKEVISNSRDEMRAMLTNGLSMNVPTLDAS